MDKRMFVVVVINPLRMQRVTVVCVCVCLCVCLLPLYLLECWPLPSKLYNIRISMILQRFLTSGFCWKYFVQKLRPHLRSFSTILRSIHGAGMARESKPHLSALMLKIAYYQIHVTILSAHPQKGIAQGSIHRSTWVELRSRDLLATGIVSLSVLFLSLSLLFACWKGECILQKCVHSVVQLSMLESLYVHVVIVLYLKEKPLLT